MQIMYRLLERRIGLSVAMFSLAPYLSLLGYMSASMHATENVASRPGSLFLCTLFLVGVLFPLAGTGLVLKCLVENRNEFRLRLLLESYFSLILVFATAFAVLQASSDSPSIRGMETVWDSTHAMSFAEHRNRLHDVYIDSLYLSALTITTVGYGDMTPVSAPAKLIAALEGIVGVGFLGLAVGHYFSVCIHRRERRLPSDGSDTACCDGDIS